MTTINFPSSPSLNENYSFEGKTWRYDGSVWLLEVTPLVTKLNSSFNAANSASSYANSAFEVANTAAAGGYDGWARDSSNSASSYANSAFEVANAAYGGAGFTLSLEQQNFVGDGSNDTFLLSTQPFNENYILVTINGVVQHKDSYILETSNVVFDTIPELNDSIDVVIFSSVANENPIDSYSRDSSNSASSYANSAFAVANTSNSNIIIVGDYANSAFAKANTVPALTYNYRKYIGDGTTVNYTVTSGMTANSVIVSENGVIQDPYDDYTVSGTTLTFLAAPENNVKISIRELPISS